MKKHIPALLSALLFATSTATPSPAAGLGLLARLRGHSSEDAGAPQGVTALNYGDRALYVHIPQQLPPAGSRALVVVLHGGMGNAERIASGRNESSLNMNDTADKYGFIVAYMNGTPVTRNLGNDKKGWNAGECCGQSSDNNIDDVSYITGAVQYLEEQYGIDPARVYGTGHSNGAMMTQRLMCETRLLQSGVSISGALQIDITSCPGAKGRKILEIHGGKDTNVPIEGGYGSGISRNYPKRSQAYSEGVFTGSGAQYILQVYPEAGHGAASIAEAIEEKEGITMQEKIARFFNLVP